MVNSRANRSENEGELQIEKALRLKMLRHLVQLRPLPPRAGGESDGWLPEDSRRKSAEVTVSLTTEVRRGRNRSRLVALSACGRPCVTGMPTTATTFARNEVV